MRNSIELDQGPMRQQSRPSVWASKHHGPKAKILARVPASGRRRCGNLSRRDARPASCPTRALQLPTTYAAPAITPAAAAMEAAPTVAPTATPLHVRQNVDVGQGIRG